MSATRLCKSLIYFCIFKETVAVLYGNTYYETPCIYLAKHRTISTITTFVSVRGFERKLQVAYRVHLLNAWYIVIFMADN